MGVFLLKEQRINILNVFNAACFQDLLFCQLLRSSIEPLDMRGRILLILSIFLSFNSVKAQSFQGPFLHEDLDQRGPYLHSLVKELPRRRTDALNPVLDMGERFYQWLEFINDARDVDQKISLSSPETTRGYPIESPIYNNENLVLESFQNLKDTLPQYIHDILFEGAPFISQLPVSDEDFITDGLEVDRVYSRASRWRLQENNLTAYAARKKSDIRGYYYLNQIEDIDAFFSDWNVLTAEEQETYRVYLIGLCFNSTFTTEQFCENKLHRKEQDHNLRGFYNEYFPVGEAKWNSFFNIQNARRDVTWNSANPDLMSVPFTDPEDTEIESFLADNIEDEWHWNNWQLRLDFENYDRSSAYVVFEPGATPHVNGLGGNQITMDANRPMTEYSAQWTIRHEYGHVLGIPDCYVEFYDTRTSEMVSYQLDITNLMCSRRGHIMETHFDELQKAYYQE